MLSVLDVMNPKNQKDVNGLIRALENQGDSAVRAEAALSLGQLGDPQAVVPLIATLQNDDDPYVRSLAANALGELGDSRARDALLNCLENDTLEVGLEASKAVSRRSPWRTCQSCDQDEVGPWSDDSGSGRPVGTAGYARRVELAKGVAVGYEGRLPVLR